MKSQLTCILILAGALFATTVTATELTVPNANQNAPDISGTYHCTGFDPYAKTPFSETMELSKSGATYVATYLDANKYPYNLGTAIFNRAVNNVVSVVFWDPRKTNYFGGGLFEIKPDGTLEGAWSQHDTKLMGTETCKKK